MLTLPWISGREVKSFYPSPVNSLMLSSRHSTIMLRSLLGLVLLAAYTAAPAFADVPIPTAPTVDARGYIVVDYRTGKVLASQEAVTRMEPASLTKLMTAYLASLRAKADVKINQATLDKKPS